MEEVAGTAQLRQPKVQGELHQALRKMCFYCSQSSRSFKLHMCLYGFCSLSLHVRACVCVACNDQCMIRALPVLSILPLYEVAWQGSFHVRDILTNVQNYHILA